MKKVFSFLAILGIILASNCSRIPVNNDPIIGIWTKHEVQTDASAGKQTIQQEWIFNDAYLGRFHKIENGSMTVKTDFKWKVEDGTYTISYPGLDRKDDIVILQETLEPIQLAHNDGTTLALRD